MQFSLLLRFLGFCIKFPQGSECLAVLQKANYGFFSLIVVLTISLTPDGVFLVPECRHCPFTCVHESSKLRLLLAVS